MFQDAADFPAIVAPCAVPTRVSDDLGRFAAGRKFRTLLLDPPWRFQNATGKVAPEHRRLSRYPTLSFEEIYGLPIADLCEKTAHVYLWVPNALLPEGLECLRRWGFAYKTNVVWFKVRKDGGPDGRGVGFYFRNVTELVLFGVRGPGARTEQAGRRQVNLLATRKREHSRKPDEMYRLVEACSRGPFLEVFARGKREGWTSFGNQAEERFGAGLLGPSPGLVLPKRPALVAPASPAGGLSDVEELEVA